MSKARFIHADLLLVHLQSAMQLQEALPAYKLSRIRFFLRNNFRRWNVGPESSTSVRFSSSCKRRKEKGEKGILDWLKNRQKRHRQQPLKNNRERLGLKAIKETAAPRNIETPLKHILRRRLTFVLWEIVPRRHYPDGKGDRSSCPQCCRL